MFGNGKKKILLACLAAFAAMPAFAEEAKQAVGHDGAATPKVLLSATLRSVLQAGVEVPVQLSNLDTTEENPAEQIIVAQAQITLQDDILAIRSVRLVSNEENVALSESLQARLRAVKDLAMPLSNALPFGDNATLKLDPARLRVVLSIHADGFGVKTTEKSSVLGRSSSSGLSGVFNYNFNVASNHNLGETQNTGYLGFSSIQSMGEHHFLFDGSIYTPATSGGKSVVIDRAVYERDFEGRKLTTGLMDSWSLQSLGQVSTLNGTRLLGVSYGNASDSFKLDRSQSLVPIHVYFPAAGEARVYREGRLLAVQQFSMGNHEVDTAKLPGGLYDVKVDVVVGGRVQSSSSFRVNKPESGNDRGNDISWQIWGGAGKDSRVYGQDTLPDKQSEQYRGVGGVSLAGRWLETDWNTSLYYNRDTLVEEAAVRRTLFDVVQLDLQNLFATDGTRRHMASISVPLPAGMGNVSYTTEDGKTGSRLDYTVEKRSGASLSLNLSNIYHKLGSLTASWDRTGDSQNGTRVWRWDYNQQVYSGRMANVSMSVGGDRTTTFAQGYGSKTKSHYLMLNLSIPMGADFSVAYSQNNGSNQLDLTAGKSFEGPITYVGANLTQETSRQTNAKQSSYNVYANFDAKYGAGTVSASGNGDNRSLSATSSGSIGWSAAGDVGFGSGSGTSGVIINAPSDNNGGLSARINDQSYPLKGGSNFVALPAYQKYRVQVEASGEEGQSYEVDSTTQELTLYPGNVSRYQAVIKPMITVFGKLVSKDGQPLAGAKLQNHIGTTVAMDDGTFSIDVDRNHPEVKVEVPGQGQFDVAIELNEQFGAMQLEDIRWDGAESELHAGAEQRKDDAA